MVMTVADLLRSDDCRIAPEGLYLPKPAPISGPQRRRLPRADLNAQSDSNEHPSYMKYPRCPRCENSSVHLLRAIAAGLMKGMVSACRAGSLRRYAR
jgi:hypothetical protein